MNIAALLTSAGINIGICVVLFSLYSILRKQPSNVGVYFGRRLASRHAKRDPFWLERFVPSPSWILKAWETTEEELLAAGGLDAVVFLRIVVFSIQMFSIAAVLCSLLVLPVNYYGKERQHKHIPSESLDVFTIDNVKEGSKWLWTHCLALYILTIAACLLLYFEYKSIAKLRLAHIMGSPPDPSHFTVLVRGIPQSSEGSYSDTVKKFFSHYHSTSYLSHQMVLKSGTVQKIINDVEMVYKMMKTTSPEDRASFLQCGFCGGPTNSFKVISNDIKNVTGGSGLKDMHGASGKECGTAFVFFKTRYAALVAAQVLQSTNPMLWVTDLAPEPHDVYWSKLGIPYRQLWIRKIATRLASVAFMLVFLIPVTLVQGMTQLEKLQRDLPFLKGILEKKYVSQLVTGYLPSVILIIFLYTVPPLMMLFSSIEGPISRSGRKKSACIKVLYFTIWNVFFVNVFTGSVLQQLNVFSSVKDIPSQLARAVPSQATFFMTYVLSSGWASLACEIIQIFPLLCALFRRFILRSKDDSSDGVFSFPYHTEVPRILLFVFLGFTCSILAPLILPFLLVYFFLAYLVYRNQILNVYISKYETGGKFWPIAHNTVVFSLIFSQIVALGVFGIKRSTVASGFTVPLIIGTLLFHEYCRQRFLPLFKNIAAEVLIDMDQQDEQSGRLEEIYKQLSSAYCQLTSASHDLCKSQRLNLNEGKECICIQQKSATGEESNQTEGSCTIDCSSNEAESH